MKVFRYIFIVFVVGIVIYASYIIYQNNRNKKSQSKIQESIQDETVIKDIRLGICNYDSINPLITNNREIIDIDRLIYEPLFTITKDYKIEPCLATECSKTGDTTYVVKIDTNVKWHDGAYLTAKDVQFSIEKIQEGNSIYKSNVERISNMEVLDAATIKIVLDSNVPFFEYNLTFPIMSNVQYYNKDFFESQEVPMGTGRFKITSSDSTSITLSKNTAWRKISTDESKIETVKINIYQSMGGVFNGFKLGNVDIFSTTNFDYQDHIGTIGFNVTNYPGRDFDYLSFNCQDSVLEDKYVRQAINYALDRNQLVNSVFGTRKMVSTYPLDYGNYLYKSDDSLDTNTEKAKSILENDGWVYNNNEWTKQDEDGFKKLDFELSVQADNSERLEIANEIKEQLEDIGISIKIVPISSSVYDNIFENHSYQMLITGIYNSFNPNLSYMLSSGNLSNYENDDLNSILNSQITTKNDKILTDNYKKIYETYKEDLPFLGLYRGKNIIISTQRLAGSIEANNYSSFYNISTWYRK